MSVLASPSAWRGAARRRQCRRSALPVGEVKPLTLRPRMGNLCPRDLSVTVPPRAPVLVPSPGRIGPCFAGDPLNDQST